MYVHVLKIEAKKNNEMCGTYLAHVSRGVFTFVDVFNAIIDDLLMTCNQLGICISFPQGWNFHDVTVDTWMVPDGLKSTLD